MKQTHDKTIIDGVEFTIEELELLQIEKLTVSEIEYLDYVSTDEFWDRYAYERRSKKNDRDEFEGT